jgi:hypothetical protein
MSRQIPDVKTEVESAHESSSSQHVLHISSSVKHDQLESMLEKSIALIDENRQDDLEAKQLAPSIDLRDLNRHLPVVAATTITTQSSDLVTKDRIHSATNDGTCDTAIKLEVRFLLKITSYDDSYNCYYCCCC